MGISTVHDILAGARDIVYPAGMFDYHMHGEFCGHAEGPLEDYVLAAIERNIFEIGFSAHLPLVTAPDPYHAMVEERLPDYVRIVRDLSRKYSGIMTIRLGIEADYFPGLEDKTGRLLQSAPFDYVLGSVHFLGDWHFTSMSGRGKYAEMDPEAVIPAYFGLVGRLINSGLFDILAHPDAIIKEDFRPVAEMTPFYSSIAEMLARAGMSIEVNTAGLRRGAGKIYPDFEFLRKCVEADVPVTLGSDAHRPSDVGRDFDLAFELLAEAGVNSLAVWKNRRMTMRPIDRKGWPEKQA
ncbi:MAG: histidinol-phosphatase HisJ family protein [Candidatus Krumholzibacteriota bacterium]|nr:histidinol-phosphatase HisJ family protein [Candidatus Krumholzibacteriota bacterium]